MLRCAKLAPLRAPGFPRARLDTPPEAAPRGQSRGARDASSHFLIGRAVTPGRPKRARRSRTPRSPKGHGIHWARRSLSRRKSITGSASVMARAGAPSTSKRLSASVRFFFRSPVSPQCIAGGEVEADAASLEADEKDAGASPWKQSVALEPEIGGHARQDAPMRGTSLFDVRRAGRDESAGPEPFRRAHAPLFGPSSKKIKSGNAFCRS